MNYGEIKTHDIANGEGIRVSLFVSGCRHACKGCFNAAAWDFAYGEKFNKTAEERLFLALDKSYIKGLSLLGGEPMERENQAEIFEILRKFKARFPHKDVWCYSGYTFEQLKKGGVANFENTDEILKMINVLVDGKFVESEKDITLKFRGSKNQRVLSLENGEIKCELFKVQ
ncbi:MAG: anaerobic ribonucleoside-triphosphate reductase activating protein [Bacillota bacterium]